MEGNTRNFLGGTSAFVPARTRVAAGPDGSSMGRSTLPGRSSKSSSGATARDRLVGTWAEDSAAGSGAPALRGPASAEDSAAASGASGLRGAASPEDSASGVAAPATSGPASAGGSRRPHRRKPLRGRLASACAALVTRGTASAEDSAPGGASPATPGAASAGDSASSNAEPASPGSASGDGPASQARAPSNLAVRCSNFRSLSLDSDLR